ncbi:MurR/RpiR family transcriptional regulator [Paenibacillus tuaregi]|uniref:MurR/RpiR family transcriptional regulator n=1 Tax=Paenibacillus tuaregi TaxID=1816681 RepID=UPI0008394B60|nr:MurR/RpiR family transcriptional regulator [Paenibacillus tuaregi]
MLISVLDQLQLNRHMLSAKEKEIAEYIIQNKNTILNINIRELALKTGSSTSTITRFCKKINCDSFVDFKIKLSREAEPPEEEASVFTKVQKLYTHVVQSTAEMVKQEQVEEVVQLIKTSRRLLVFGLGSSGLSALEFKYRLMRMNIIIDAITDSHMMLMNASLLRKNDLIIGLSNSGTTQEVIDALKVGREQGASVVGITNFDHTGLTDVSDIVLFTPSIHRNNDEHFINSQLSIIYVLDIISMLLLEDQSMLQARRNTLKALYKNRE